MTPVAAPCDQIQFGKSWIMVFEAMDDGEASMRKVLGNFLKLLDDEMKYLEWVRSTVLQQMFPKVLIRSMFSDSEYEQRCSTGSFPKLYQDLDYGPIADAARSWWRFVISTRTRQAVFALVSQATRLPNDFLYAAKGKVEGQPRPS